MKFCSVLLAATSLALVHAIPSKRDQVVCPGQLTVSETFIGANNDVKLAEVYCPNNVVPKREFSGLISRQDAGTNDTCGAPCHTNCFTGAGTGPNPDDCHVIADAMKFEAQTNNKVLIGTGTNNTMVVTYQSCESFYVNQGDLPQSYCLSEWSGVIDFVAPNCQATQGAHGGNCVAQDQLWFIQVQLNNVN